MSSNAKTIIHKGTPEAIASLASCPEVVSLLEAQRYLDLAMEAAQRAQESATIGIAEDEMEKFVADISDVEAHIEVWLGTNVYFNLCTKTYEG